MLRNDALFQLVHLIEPLNASDRADVFILAAHLKWAALRDFAACRLTGSLTATERGIFEQIQEAALDLHILQMVMQ